MHSNGRKLASGEKRQHSYSSTDSSKALLWLCGSLSRDLRGALLARQPLAAGRPGEGLLPLPLRAGRWQAPLSPPLPSPAGAGGRRGALWVCSTGPAGAHRAAGGLPPALAPGPRGRLWSAGVGSGRCRWELPATRGASSQALPSAARPPAAARRQRYEPRWSGRRTHRWLPSQNGKAKPKPHLNGDV